MGMNGAPAQDVLELEVADFGPIVEAKVDLRPLTVFVGPSNTGKSYLAILIYALHRFFASDPWSERRLFGRGLPAPRSPQEKKSLHAAIDALGDMAQAVLDKRRQPDKGGEILPRWVADLVRSEFEAGGDDLGREISRCFGIDKAGSLVRRGRTNGARVVLRGRVSKDPACFAHELTLARKAELRTTVPSKSPIRIHAQEADEIVEHVRHLKAKGQEADEKAEGGRADERAHADWGLMMRLGDVVVPHFTGPLHLPAYYLPADRTGVMHAHSVVVSALIAGAPTAGLRPAARTPMLSGVLADFLEQLIDIDRPWRRRDNRNDLGAGIEKAMLDGSVSVDRSAAVDYPRFTYRPAGWKGDLALTNASSMVSELAPVVLYLRHMIVPGSVLIVEEPESHLHPAMQVEFTRQLAALVGAGVRVIVTTHSEWLLEELANIVRRSQLPEASRGGGGIALRPDQVGAWLFQPKRRPRGSVVSEIGLDDSGLYPSGFDDVAAALHNDWAEISSRIENGS